MTTDKVLSLLAATPIGLAAASEGASDSVLATQPAPEEWSANDVLAHLRSCADVWGGCIERILAEDAPTIRAMNPRTYLPQTDYPDLGFGGSFAAFAKQRAALLEVLRPLPPEAWSRSATVTGAGRPLQRSVLGYAEWLATHERAHVRQVERVVRGLAGRR